ncbi:MAG: mycofactocin-coupled SDR family oxidoreductase [Acidimicrobiales bacterium]
MTDPVAIVTGAARGIGAATARGLAAQGCRLILVDRCADDPALDYPMATPADLEATVAACGGGGCAIGVVADVRDQDALNGAVKQGTECFGGLDIAVAAAGCIAGGRPTWETGDEVWTTMMDVNAGGVWRLARAAVPAMLGRPMPRRGRFVAISSMGGSVGLPLLAPYVAAKHAVNGLVRAMAAELGPHGITVNAVAPGSTISAMLTASAQVYGLSDVTPFIDQHLLERLLDPEEVAALVSWVCGPSSSGVTGAVLPVDAGATAR